MPRCGSLNKLDGRRVEFMPILSILPGKEAFGIFPGLLHVRLDLPIWSRDKDSMRYLSVVLDFASPNILSSSHASWIFPPNFYPFAIRALVTYALGASGMPIRKWILSTYLRLLI